jgi:undecaprenyl phosphate N,N'-diacetylbacillosamine 1-phosphate transferase
MRNLFKRLLDLLVSLSATVVLSPVFVVIALAIKLTSKGPVIFRQERAGRNGVPFIFYKFRSMKPDVEPFAQSPQSAKDPRLTTVGRFLREYSLDELPQLFNVLKGDMSVVGPRPLYLSQMAKWSERQRKRLLVRPGLTGLAQISGRGEVTHEEKIELDIKYVETASLCLDAKIILTTISMVFRRKNIYEKRYSQTECTRGETEQ